MRDEHTDAPLPHDTLLLSRLLSRASPNQGASPTLGIRYAHGRKTWRYFKDEQTSCQQEGTEMPRPRWPAARWARPRAGRLPQGFQQAMARSMAGHQVTSVAGAGTGVAGPSISLEAWRSPSALWSLRCHGAGPWDVPGHSAAGEDDTSSLLPPVGRSSARQSMYGDLRCLAPPQARGSPARAARHARGCEVLER